MTDSHPASHVAIAYVAYAVATYYVVQVIILAVYLGNGTNVMAHGYYGTLIGSHRWWIDTCWFQ